MESSLSTSKHAKTKFNFTSEESRHFDQYSSLGLRSNPSPIYMSGYVVCPNLEATAVLLNYLKFPSLNGMNVPDVAQRGQFETMRIRRSVLKSGCKLHPLFNVCRRDLGPSKEQMTRGCQGLAERGKRASEGTDQRCSTHG
jgi:hypothetical protein